VDRWHSVWGLWVRLLKDFRCFAGLTLPEKKVFQGFASDNQLRKTSDMTSVSPKCATHMHQFLNLPIPKQQCASVGEFKNQQLSLISII
jgi:hypothetical protein